MDLITSHKANSSAILAILLLVLSTTMPVSNVQAQTIDTTGMYSKLNLNDLQGKWRQDHFSYLPCFDGDGIKSYQYFDSTGEFGVMELEVIKNKAYLTTPTLDHELLMVSIDTFSARCVLELKSPQKIFKKKSYLFFITSFEDKEMILGDIDYFNCREKNYFSQHTNYHMKLNDESNN